MLVEILEIFEIKIFLLQCWLLFWFLLLHLQKIGYAHHQKRPEKT